MRLKRIILILTVFFLAASLAGCRGGLKDLYSPEELRVVLDEAGGWVPLVMPDSKYRPGSIIFVNDTDGQPRWVDHLDGCVEVEDFEAFLEVGTIPPIKFGKDASLAASLLLNHRGISAGPGFDRVKKVRLSLDDHSAIAMRLVTFRSWYENLKDEDYIQKIDPCLDALEDPNYYLVNEALVINNATYRLYTETGAELELKAPELGDFLKFEQELTYAVSSDGSMTINEPIVLAIRQVMRVGGGFQILAAPGGTESISADALLEKWYVDSTE